MISMTSREFVRLVHQSYKEMPPYVVQRLGNVDVVVEEWPQPDDQNLISGDDSLFGLYQGVPMTEREGVDSMLPDLIVIYRQPIPQSLTGISQFLSGFSSSASVYRFTLAIT